MGINVKDAIFEELGEQNKKNINTHKEQKQKFLVTNSLDGKRTYHYIEDIKDVCIGRQLQNMQDGSILQTYIVIFNDDIMWEVSIEQDMINNYKLLTHREVTSFQQQSDEIRAKEDENNESQS